MTNEVAHNIGVVRSGSGNKIHGGHINSRNMALWTNKSGGNLSTAAVVVLNTGTADSFTTTTTAGDLRKVAVIPQLVTGNDVASTYTILNNETGYVFLHGRVPAATVNGVVVKGEYLKTHTVAGQLVGTGVVHSATQGPPRGTCAIALDAQAATGNIPIDLLEATVTRALNKTSAADPTVNDDIADGYTAESLWFNTATNLAFWCEDPAAGAAVWNRFSPYIDIANYKAQDTSAAEIDAFSFTIPAGLIGANGEVLLEFSVQPTNTSAGGVNYTFKTYWGGVAEVSDTIAVANHATSKQPAYKVIVTLKNKGVANSQGGEYVRATDTAARVEGGIGADSLGPAWFTGAIDTSAAVIIKASVTMASSASTISWELVRARLTVNPKA